MFHKTKIPSNQIKIIDNQLIIEPCDSSQMLGFQGNMAISLEHIKSCALAPKSVMWTMGTRRPGYLGANRAVGTFIKDKDKTYYNLRRDEAALQIDLLQEDYSQLILGLENPDEIIAQIDELRNQI